MGLGWFDVSCLSLPIPIIASLRYNVHFKSTDLAYEELNKRFQTGLRC